MFRLLMLTVSLLQEFILHSPDFEAAKFWIGNMGKTATHAVVFAQLYTPGGQCHGLHPFVVQVGCQGAASEERWQLHPRGRLAVSGDLFITAAGRDVLVAASKSGPRTLTL